MCCGLALDEQSYYEKSNPSLGDRGVTGFKETPSDPIPTFLGSQNAMFKMVKRREPHRHTQAERQLRHFSHTNVGVFSLLGGGGGGWKPSTSRHTGQADEKAVPIFVKNTACFLRFIPNFLNVNIDPSRKQEMSGLEILTLITCTLGHGTLLLCDCGSQLRLHQYFLPPTCSTTEAGHPRSDRQHGRGGGGGSIWTVRFSGRRHRLAR